MSNARNLANLLGTNTKVKDVDLDGTELVLDADADTSITADTDDQIDIRISGADDFAFKANTFEVQTGSNIDMNGTELILDADADTSITADTDDQIDIKIGGADDFAFKANKFEVQTGSNIDMNGTELILDADGDTSIEASSDDIIVFDTGGSERLRLDADGNLLSGKASTAFGTVGHRISPTGFAHHTRTGGSNGTDPCLGLNLLSNDGNLVELYKDSSQVGSIGVADGDNLTISSTASAHGGLKFNNTAMSAYVDGASSDGTMDIGTSVVRFKDLYLSGGLYVGGTGSANYLDDYEEGAWVPVFQNDGSTNYTVHLGKYIKIGDMVVATFHIDILSNNAIGGNHLTIENLPFTVANSSNQYGNISGLHCGSWSTSTKPDNGLAIPNTTPLLFYRTEGQTGIVNVTGNDIGEGNLLGHVIFFTS